MLAVYLDIENSKTAKIITCNDSEEINKLLGCRDFDIVRGKIGEFVYDIYCDEGPRRESCKPSAFNKNGKAILFGNLIFCRADSYGENLDLTIEEIGNLSDYFYQYFDLEYGFYTIIYGVEYG